MIGYQLIATDKDTKIVKPLKVYVDKDDACNARDFANSSVLKFKNLHPKDLANCTFSVIEVDVIYTMTQVSLGEIQ